MLIWEVREVLILLGLSLLFISKSSEARAKARLELSCIFQDKRYSPGETWHPYLEPHGLAYCIQCRCSETGAVSCNEVKCPALQCENAVAQPHLCCPTCPVPSGLRAPVKSCQYNGTTYQQGETFTAEDLFPTRQPDQCVQCSCSEGHIYCGLQTCPKLACSSPVKVQDTCCTVCSENASEKSMEEDQSPLNRSVRHSKAQCVNEPWSKRTLKGAPSIVNTPPVGLNPRGFRQKGGGTTVKIILKKKHKKACIYGGKTYSHGEVWNPVLRPFGVLPCILCTCKDGTHDCMRINCPEEYPCERPEKLEGKCCRTCPESKDNPTQEANQSKCSSSSPGSILVYQSVSPNGGSSGKTQAGLQRIAIEREGSGQVELYTWKQVNSVFHLIQIEKLEKHEFKQQAANFRLLTGGQWKLFPGQEADLSASASAEKDLGSS
ncbi:chordin-like protein 2 isoform X1 [Latimeria chalumnae]|uniref:chordin-like protein 2 isoform X1 n=1 Tax=Latimeria chalumnae TaxID=7897 RepID=UPI00313ACA7A